jgi:rubrerythrin
MVTTVGLENQLEGLIADLIQLEIDAIAAYETTIDKLENPTFKAKIGEFRGDHMRHLQELNELADKYGIPAPTKGDAKQMLTTGKIQLASMVSDKTILKAMKTNEDDTVTAYERASRHEAVVDDAERGLFRRALADEMRHREWMETASSS